MPGYAGADDFLSHTTWLPTSLGEGFCVGDSRTMKPMRITIVGQICPRASSLNPFYAVTGWDLPVDFHGQSLRLSIVDPWQFDGMVYNDYLRGIKNLRLLSRSISFPSFCNATSLETTLNTEQLYNDVISLRIPFFQKRVSFHTSLVFGTSSNNKQPLGDTRA
jgi:hypothetical protein